MDELQNPRLVGVVRLCIGYALELAFFKSVTIAGKQRKVWSQACVSPMTDQTMLILHDTCITVTRPHMSMCIAAPCRLCMSPYDRACVHRNRRTTTQHK